MECSFRSNYSLRFYHDELSEVGFDANHLTRLYRYTADDLIKFEVAWDDEMSPHFSFQHGYPVIDSGTAPGSFYIHFVQWLKSCLFDQENPIPMLPTYPLFYFSTLFFRLLLLPQIPLQRRHYLH